MFKRYLELIRSFFGEIPQIQEYTEHPEEYINKYIKKYSDVLDDSKRFKSLLETSGK